MCTSNCVTLRKWYVNFTKSDILINYDSMRKKFRCISLETYESITLLVQLTSCKNMGYWIIRTNLRMSFFFK